MFKLKQFKGLLLIVMLVAAFTMQLETKADAATPTISDATVQFSSSLTSWCDANRAQCWNYNPALYCVVRTNDPGCDTWCRNNRTACYKSNPPLYCDNITNDPGCK